MSIRFVTTPGSFGASRDARTKRDLAHWVARAHAAHVSRRELADLDPRLLQDIGVSATQALFEAGRAPWDIEPATPGRGSPRRNWGIGGALAHTRSALHAAMRRWRSRQRISGLDQHTLRDIGVSYAEAEREANKPFWQA